jgi:hypothetical protein
VKGSGSCNGWAASTSGSTARASFFSSSQTPAAGIWEDQCDCMRRSCGLNARAHLVSCGGKVSEG